jgi:RNA polymerase sigma-70 factor (ECF subfamily)
VANHSEDRELVERMLAGDGAAFEAFAERYSRALYRFAQARLGGDREATREVVQTAMCKALAKLDTYRGEASLLTWLCACCRNEMLMRFRSRRTAPAEVEIADDVEPAAGFRPAGAGSPEVALLEREAARRVHLALDLLPAHYARALEWKYLESLTVQEIAARLNLGPKAAESLLTRARSAFRAGYESLRTRRQALEAGLDERVLSDG